MALYCVIIPHEKPADREKMRKIARGNFVKIWIRIGRHKKGRHHFGHKGRLRGISWPACYVDDQSSAGLRRFYTSYDVRAGDVYSHVTLM